MANKEKRRKEGEKEGHGISLKKQNSGYI